MTNRFQVLSLDGGGLRGVFTASFLVQWEKDTGSRVVDHFDLIAGTSTGGIIALALGMGYSAEEILNFYIEEGEKIFPTTFLGNLKRAVTTKYSDQGLNTALEKYFADRRLGESTKRLLIPSFYARQSEVYIFKTAHHPRLRNDYRELASLVARSTAAAPTYLEPAVRESGMDLIDGGIWANNPVMLAVSEALGYLENPIENVAALRVGTTQAAVSVDDYPQGRAGAAVALPLIAFMMRAQEKSASGMARHVLGDERYYEVNPQVASKDFELDKLSTELVGLGDFEYRTHSSEIAERGFFSHQAAPFEPAYKLE